MRMSLNRPAGREPTGSARTRRWRFLPAPVLLAAVLGALVFPVGQAQAATASMCVGEQPEGYGWFVTRVVVNGCGSSNLWDLTSWYDQPLGSYMAVCDADQGFHPGWAQLQLPAGTSPLCGGPFHYYQRQGVGEPYIAPGAIVNAQYTAHFTPGSTIVIFGINFYPNDTVSVNGVPATVLYDSLANGQINAVLPSSVGVGPASVVVTNGAAAGAQQSPPYSITISAS